MPAMDRLLEDRDGASDESTGSAIASDGEEDHRWQAAEILGISDRHMRRWRERYEEFGYDGLFDRRRGQPRPKRVPIETVEQVLGRYREKYFDFNVRHFHEKLVAEHGIGLSYTWVKQARKGRDKVGGDANEESIANAGRGLYRPCCCISMTAIAAGFGTSAGTT